MGDIGDEVDAVVNRLRRAQGQVGAVIRMLEDGRDCTDIVTQLAAASRALDRAGVAIISNNLRKCLIASGGSETVDTLKLERLFLSLA